MKRLVKQFWGQPSTLFASLFPLKFISQRRIPPSSATFFFILLPSSFILDPPCPPSPSSSRSTMGEDNISRLKNAAALSGGPRGHPGRRLLRGPDLARIDRQPGVRVIEVCEEHRPERRHVCRHPGRARRRHRCCSMATGKMIRQTSGNRRDRKWRRPRVQLSGQSRTTTFKRLQSRVANFVRSHFTGDEVRDTGCTLKAMRRECREALVLAACIGSCRR